MAKLWSNPTKYLSENSQFGSTNDEVYKVVKSAFKKRNKKLMVTAFGPTQFPASAKVSPDLSAEALAKFVEDCNLDGVDIYFTDQKAFVEGIAEEWLIKFTQKLRDLLPLHIISHSPYATFFDEKEYKNGGYTKIHN